MIEFSVKTREVLGKKVEDLRGKGVIPAVIYGAKTKSVPLEIDYDEFEKIYKEAGESTIIKLKIKNIKSEKDEVKNVLIYNVAHHPVSGKFIHIDFYAEISGQDTAFCLCEIYIDSISCLCLHSFGKDVSAGLGSSCCWPLSA